MLSVLIQGSITSEPSSWQQSHDPNSTRKSITWSINIILENALKQLQKGFSQSSCCQVTLTSPPPSPQASPQSLILLLLQVRFQICHPQMEKSNAWHRFSGVTAFKHLCNRTPLWPSRPNYGSQITDPGSCLLNQMVKSQEIVLQAKYIFILPWVWNSTRKKSRPWLELTLTLRRRRRCLKRRESV